MYGQSRYGGKSVDTAVATDRVSNAVSNTQGRQASGDSPAGDRHSHRWLSRFEPI
ncbi:hypothetical protein HSR121_2160 [Halapricum desulfuricans]|uniref:Uncharacterized protein n=1 Tax=Halapricum desulfuricans TaxID=2841257 RepID=A0A897MWJ6_9EURY|nr:hypothetical protein HSR121_2160 [Halapricum desulfuricans]